MTILTEFDAALNQVRLNQARCERIARGTHECNAHPTDEIINRGRARLAEAIKTQKQSKFMASFRRNHPMKEST